MDWLHLHDLRHPRHQPLAQGSIRGPSWRFSDTRCSRLTMDTYAHVLDQHLDAAAAAMNRALEQL
jgi:hypothetical protein